MRRQIKRLLSGIACAIDVARKRKMSREIYRKPVAEQCLLWEVNRFTPDKERERERERERDERFTWKFTLRVDSVSFLVSLQEVRCARNWIRTFLPDNVTRHPSHRVMDTIEWDTSRRKIEVETSRQRFEIEISRATSRADIFPAGGKGAEGGISLESFSRIDYHGDPTRNWN